MPTHAPQSRENLEYLLAHLTTVQAGLDALIDLLSRIPAEQTVRAESVHVLLQPLASEADQAEPIARMLLDAEPTA